MFLTIGDYCIILFSLFMYMSVTTKIHIWIDLEYSYRIVEIEQFWTNDEKFHDFYILQFRSYTLEWWKPDSV